uniref:Uncharacterized protein n=1 Tax=Zea mays TaxID=4577 RepID=C0P8D0_MAIZE|nr:unknown [Zea mays]
MLPASCRIWNLQNMKMVRATPTKTSTTTISPSDSDFHEASSIRHLLPPSIAAAPTSAYTRRRSRTATAATGPSGAGAASSRTPHEAHPSLLTTRRSPAAPPTATAPSVRTATAVGVRAQDTVLVAPSSMSTRRTLPELGWPTSRKPRLTCAVSEARGTEPSAGADASVASSPSTDSL